jgi:putative methionine-R-sulfoxide reductase with GAF domain
MSRLAELSAQYATVEEILEQPSPLPQRLHQLCRHLCDHVAHYVMAGVYTTLHRRPGELTLMAAAGRRPYPPAVSYGEGLWGRAADAGQTAAAHHLAGVAEGVARPWIGAQLAVPLQGAGTLIGLLAVDSDQPAPFLPDDELFLENVGDLIAVRLSLGAMPSNRSR